MVSLYWTKVHPSPSDILCKFRTFIKEITGHIDTLLRDPYVQLDLMRSVARLRREVTCCQNIQNVSDADHRPQATVLHMRVLFHRRNIGRCQGKSRR